MKWWLVGLAGLVSGQVLAQTQTPGNTFDDTQSLPYVSVSARSPRIDPTFALLRHHVKHGGHRARIFGSGLSPHIDLRGAGALLKFRSPPNQADLLALQAHGIRLRTQNGLPVRIGLIFSAWVPFDALDGLAQSTQIERLEATWTPSMWAPLDTTTVEVGSTFIQRLPEFSVDGTGVLVADIDSGIDPTHPHFFFADGGRFAWIDANTDGQFTPGTDGVDLNTDGRLAPNERLGVLDAGAVHEGQVTDADGMFQPHRDWLYIDANQNRRRDAGLDAGFTEEDLAFGEAIFVAEDVDLNGNLDPGEVLLRLGTSKVRAVVHDSNIYTRGESLLDVTTTPGFAFVFHGTGVASILLGGQPAHDRRGVAPGAELLAYPILADFGARQNFDASLHFEAMADAVDRGAHIILHEWTDAFRAPHDGSSLLEEAMATTREQNGVIHITPTGNLTTSGKHTSAVATAGAASLPFVVSAPTTLVFGSLMWAGDSAELQLRTPDGGTFDVSAGQPVAFGNGQFVQTVAQATSHGFQYIQFFAWSDDQTLPVGVWRLEASGLDAPNSTVFGRITDDDSGWAPGTVGWQTPETTATLTFPATADAAFAVAAHAGRWPMAQDGSQVGQLRGFSGRGPRFDGARSVDLSAPDDPYAAIPATPEFLDNGYERGWLSTFGGTSGAAPHVAGAFALLRQAFPAENPPQLEQRLVDGARQVGIDPSLGSEFPNPAAGWGALDIVTAAGASRPPATNRPPTVTLVATDGRLDAFVTDPDQDPVQVRFDIDHDGVFDTEFSDELSWNGTAPNAPWARAEARDVYGTRAGALASWNAAPMDEDPDSGIPDAAEPNPPAQPVEECGGCTSGSASATWLTLGVVYSWRRRRRRL